MAPARRQSTAKAPPPPQMPTPSTAAATPSIRGPTVASTPPSKLKIHALLEVYEATISSLIGTLSEEPFRSEAIQDYTARLLQCEDELEEALEEGNSLRKAINSSETTSSKRS
jgi:hypothetical protein